MAHVVASAVPRVSAVSVMGSVIRVAVVDMAHRGMIVRHGLRLALRRPIRRVVVMERRVIGLHVVVARGVVRDGTEIVMLVLTLG